MVDHNAGRILAACLSTCCDINIGESMQENIFFVVNSSNNVRVNLIAVQDAGKNVIF
jgi:hypothetical protein